MNLLVEFDPVVTDHATMQTAVTALLDHATDHAPEVSTHEVAVCYDADLGPDLSAVAQAKGTSDEAVIAAHLAGDYRVGMYGFAPGYAYLTGLDPTIEVPRKQIRRTRCARRIGHHRRAAMPGHHPKNADRLVDPGCLARAYPDRRHRETLPVQCW